MHPIEARSPWRLWLLGAALAVALLALLLQQSRPAARLGTLPLYDFVEYWAAGRLNARGENPYDLEAIRQLQHQVGHHAEPILMWNPPWTLAVVMPFGLLECRVAHLLWLLLHLVVLVFCAAVLYCLYGGPTTRAWLALAVVFAFLPTYFALTAGQISPLLVLGAVGFLHFVDRRQDLLAGACAALLGIKPHLAYLFWIALLLWSVRQRRWKVLIGGTLTGLAASAVALACNPAVLGQYLHTFQASEESQLLAQYRSPTLGTLIRLALGGGSFRLQFLALVPGLVWFALYWRRHRSDWSWPQHFPPLLLASILTAAYGAWPFDLVLLMVPVIQKTALLARQGKGLALASLGFLLGNGLALMQVMVQMEYLWFIWMAPAVLLGYLIPLKVSGEWSRWVALRLHVSHTPHSPPPPWPGPT
jgi:hypothetical protein